MDFHSIHSLIKNLLGKAFRGGARKNSWGVRPGDAE